MRSILLQAEKSPGMPMRLETALALARWGDGHMTVLFDTPVSRYMAMDPMGGSYLLADALTQALDANEAEADALEAHLQKGDVAFDTVQSTGEAIDVLASGSLLADVVVVSRSGGLAGELAVRASAPILALRDDRPLAFPLASVCIGWDGSAESAAALKASVPLLRDCPLVRVITVGDEGEGFPSTDALRYLSRHGVRAELERLERLGSVEETLGMAIGRAQADLFVMGAYGNSRLREYLFGGVTAHFLRQQDAPALLLAH